MDTKAIIRDLATWEGFTTWLYCDTKGLVTVGIGCLVKTPESLIGVEMWDGDRLATLDDKAQAHARVRSAFFDRDPDAAISYKQCSKLRLTLDEVMRLAADRLESGYLPHLRAMFDGFDELSTAWQSALIDIVYNCGCAGFDEFHHLIDAVRRRDGVAASKSCHRKTSRDARNAWAAAQFLKPC